MGDWADDARKEAEREEFKRKKISKTKPVSGVPVRLFCRDCKKTTMHTKTGLISTRQECGAKQKESTEYTSEED